MLFSPAVALISDHLSVVNPRHYQSGTSVNKSVHISKVGDSTLRKSLYMPALAAIRHNPVIRNFYTGLVNRGKPKKSAVVACMRKLVHIIYGVLKNEMPFDPNWESEIVTASN